VGASSSSGSSCSSGGNGGGSGSGSSGSSGSGGGVVNKKCAASLLFETVRWRKESLVGQQAKATLLEGAKAKQLHVSGYDRKGRPVVIYSPTTEADCPG
jgi:hypothetical protein